MFILSISLIGETVLVTQTRLIQQESVHVQIRAIQREIYAKIVCQLSIGTLQTLIVLENVPVFLVDLVILSVIEIR